MSKRQAWHIGTFFLRKYVVDQVDLPKPWVSCFPPECLKRFDKFSKNCTSFPLQQQALLVEFWTFWMPTWQINRWLCVRTIESSYLQRVHRRSGTGSPRSGWPALAGCSGESGFLPGSWRPGQLRCSRSGESQVWSLTQFYSVDFLQSRIGV